MLAISSRSVENLIYIIIVDIQPMKNMKSILTETALLCEAIAFWLVALPAAVVVFPAMALWEEIGKLVKATAGAHSPTLCEG